MGLSREQKERVLENYLNNYKTYKVGIKNCQKQLEYLMPSLVCRFDTNGKIAQFYIANNTEQVALDRITSKKALDLQEEIEQFGLIVCTIDEAVKELDELQQKFVDLRYFHGLKMNQVQANLMYYEERTLYRIRKQIMDKLLISLSNLLSLK